MSLLGRPRTGPRLFAAFLLVFVLSSAATAVGLVGVGGLAEAASTRQASDKLAALARRRHSLVGQFTV
jgi:hypothetical protein